MPRKTLKQLSPSAARMRSIKSLSLLGDWIYQPNLWHINRYSASMAFFVGLFMAFAPVPGQMVFAALLAVLFRCNLPLSVGLVWITNPITMPAIFYLAYRIGALIMQVPPQPMSFELSFKWLSESLSSYGQPFLVGCLICGLFFGSVGYFVINVMWRLRVIRYWRKRKRERRERRQNQAKNQAKNQSNPAVKP